MKLVIGNKRYSSWSLRPWLLLKHFEIPFEEILIPLDTPETREQILKVSPTGKVPALIDGALTVWESLAIAEYLNDKHPSKQMWPEDLAKRAVARSVSHEMHAGFSTLRTLLPHDLQKTLKDFDYSKANEDIQRIQQIWTECLKASGGPFLFGKFSIADAMYAPVVNRFVSYGVPARGVCAEYVQAIRALPAHQTWIQEAMTEALVMPRYGL